MKLNGNNSMSERLMKYFGIGFNEIIINITVVKIVLKIAAKII